MLVKPRGSRAVSKGNPCQGKAAGSREGVVWHFPEELCREQQPRKSFQCLAGEDEESVSTMSLSRNSGLSQNHSLGAKVEFWILISLW